MYYLDKRIQVICNQLERFRVTKSRSLNDWQYKFGLFFHPEEADAAEAPWENFDCSTMRWYATYDGSDQFEGKFQGHGGDFRGIHGEHYWFRTTVTVPEEMDGQPVWMKICTQIDGWDSRNHQ